MRVRRPRQKPSKQMLAYRAFKSVINNDGSIYVASLPEFPSLQSVPRASFQTPGNVHSKRTEFFLSEGLVSAVLS